MVGALWTGISGLAGSQTALDNESNNIANVNTIGYKSSRISFADQMYQDKIGKGVTSFDVEKMYTQGNLKLTGVSYDMALSGDGFFQVSDGQDTYYTRAGNFRMGESGTLEDVGKNKVQGWSMQPLTSDDITSTDNNATYFTNDFTKLLGNKVIRDTTTIETIIAKATDYTTTATTDNNTVYTGAGYKTASTKIADVEQLITEYNGALTIYSDADPKPTASTSRVQMNMLDFDLDNATTVLATGDEVYAYIDGVKYSQSFDTNEATTFQKFADVLSNTPGFKAHMVDVTNTAPYDPDTSSTTGELYLESIIPGKSFRITEFGWTDASNSNQATKGALSTVQTAVLGTGMGHINSIRDALSESVSGKQEDVYSTSELFFSTTNTLNDLTYQISIYDKTQDTNVTVPATALTIADAADVDAVVAGINGNTGTGLFLANYVKAYNINGNLVIKTLDTNNDVEFTGSLTSTTDAEVQTVTITGPEDGTGNVVFLGTTLTGTTSATAAQIGAAIIANETAIISAWNGAAAQNGGTERQISDLSLSGSIVTVTYTNATLNEAGTGLDIVSLDNTDALEVLSQNGVAFTVADTTNGGSAYTLVKNANYSGREGAAAEFLQINTTINQTASKGDLQLRLDSLSLTDSAFGDFSVDDTGLITMQQDGTDFAVGQIAVAKFTDNRGMEAVGDNLLKATNRSGAAIFNINNDKTADVKGGTLELSTADLSESLVNLMVFQRAFEANAKSITTADQILTTLIQLKR